MLNLSRRCVALCFAFLLLMLASLAPSEGAQAGGQLQTPNVPVAVGLTLPPPNTPPDLVDDTNSIKEDAAPNPISGNVLTNDSDLDGNALSVTNAGTITLNYGVLVIQANGSYTYTLDNNNPAVNALNNGQTLKDAFTYNVSDGHGGTGSAKLEITINGTTDNHPPTADADTNSIKEDTAPNPISGNVLANDSDSDDNVLSVTNTGTFVLDHGVLVIHADGTYTFTLDNSNPAVNALNNGQHLTDAFTYNISDGHGGTDSSTLTITINGTTDSTNTSPVAENDNNSVKEDTAPNPVSGNVLTNDSDDDGNTLSVTNAGTFPLGHGILVIHADGSYTYTLDNSDPAVNALNNGEFLTDPFTYNISDGHGGTDAATLTIVINGTDDNTPPVADGDTNSVKEDAAPNSVSGNVLTNDTDVDGNTLSVTSAGTFPLTFGVLVIHADGSYTYTLDNNNPAVNALNNGQHLTDPFTYSISDGHGGTDSATLTITINGTTDNTPPAANADDAFVKEDSAPNPISGNLLTNDSDADGDAISVTNAGTLTLAYGVLVIHADGTYTYTLDNANPAVNALNDGQTLTDPFTYNISDGHGGTGSASLEITINGTTDNSPPSAGDDSGSITEDSNPNPVSGNVLTNDSDADGNALSVANAGTFVLDHGALVVHADGSYTYTLDNSDSAVDALNEGQTLADSFTYNVSDGHGGVDAAALTITINGKNDAPIAIDDPRTIAEDSGPLSFNVLANDTDVDDSTLSLGSGSYGSYTLNHGSLTLNAAGDAVYTPDPDANGEDTFTYQVADGHGGTDSAVIALTITPVNDAPVAADDDATTDEDAAVTIDALLNDTDIDLNTLTIKSVSTPTHGTAEIVDGKIVYTPDANSSGADSFTYTIGDGSDLESTATVTIDVAEVNDPPVALDDEAETDEDTAVALDVLQNDSDLDLDTLIISEVGVPGHGTADISNGQITYTPSANYFGADSFTYVVSDGRGGADEGLVEVTINSINDRPVAVDDDATTNEDEPVGIDVLVNDTDADLDTLAISAAGLPGHGTAEVANGQVTYTPNTNYHGADSFTYTVSDGHGGVDDGVVEITVNPVNDPPVAADDEAMTDEDTPVTIDVLHNDTDVDLDELAISLVGTAGHGVAEIAGNQVVYTPDADYHGSDSFSYEVSDGFGGTDEGSVAITVNSINDQPVAIDDEATTNEDIPVTIDVLVNDTDVDLDTLVIRSIGSPGLGSAEIVDGKIVYTPNGNVFGVDSFTYTIGDGSELESTATVTVTVNSVNDQPVSLDDESITDEDTPVTISVLANDTDADGDAIEITGIADPANGSAEIVAGQILYTPDPNVFGADSFQYTISDPDGAIDTALVTVTVNAVNDAPVAGPALFAGTEDITFTGSLASAASDVDGDPLEFSSSPEAAAETPGGSVEIAPDGSFTYTPSSDFHGDDTFVYQVCDPSLACAANIATISIASENDAPVATDDAFSVAPGGTVTGSVASNDSDSDGDSLTFVRASDPAQGTLELNDDGSFTYSAFANATGSDAISYSASDPGGLVATATLTISIVDAPAISLSKTSDTTGPLVAGDTITYTFTVTNTGNLPLVSVIIDDSLLGQIACADELPFGEAVSCSATYVVTDADAEAGSVFNSAVATASTEAGMAVTATADLSIGVCQPGTTPPLQSGTLTLGIRALQAVTDGTPVAELPSVEATEESTAPAGDTPSPTVTAEPAVTATATVAPDVDPADDIDGTPTAVETEVPASPSATATPSCDPIPQPTAAPTRVSGGTSGPVVSQLPSTGTTESGRQRGELMWALLAAAALLTTVALSARRGRSRS